MLFIYTLFGLLFASISAFLQSFIPIYYNKLVNNIIVEADKKKIKTIGDLKNIINSAVRSSKKTIMIAIFNNQNQRRYIGVKLD